MKLFVVFSLVIPLFIAKAGLVYSEDLDIHNKINVLKVPPDLDYQEVELGRKLFFETRLSKDNSISCAHCHNLDSGGVDNLQHSFGVNGAEGNMNSPTVYNTGLNIAQFWDGRAASLEEQVNGPIHNTLEMSSNWGEVILKLRKDSFYVDIFKQLYGSDSLNPENIRHAIAEFERSLVTVNSPFDRYLAGDKDALTQQQKKGFELFENYGCTSCHQGANVGGNMFQILGVFGDYYEGRHSSTNLGRENVTGLKSDRHKFKVPSLRLVTLTAPYFHDGSVETLYDAIQVMANYQLGRQIPDHDIEFIIGFLDSLVGDLNTERKMK